MTAKEIHDNLLSLFIRGLGVWLLYEAAQNANVFVENFRALFFPPDNTWKFDPWQLAELFLRVLVAAYFILGAPPFLKWTTRSKAGNG